MTPSQCFLSVLLLVVLSCITCVDVDVNDEEVQKIATFAGMEINGGTNDMHIMMVTKIVKAKREVVAGINFHLTLEMTLTDCVKGDSLV
ncbi:cystatin-like isoform X2 [Amphiura filiformis]|uniref:cystatin-like isoform X2 n=1 Tax=Amphiura filiformis TaxID=82378 RepID=UPI003B213378